MTNEQALTDESARESGNILLIVAARMARRELFTPLHFVSELPQKVVSMRTLREALERSEETLQREVCKIVDGHDRMQKKLKEAEEKVQAAEKRIAEFDQRIRTQNRHTCELFDEAKAQRQRVTELESREVKLPSFDGYVPHIANELQAAFRIACADAGIRIKGD